MNAMGNLQFFAVCFSLFSGIVTASWIIGQNISKNRMADKDARFVEGERRMDKLEARMDLLKEENSIAKTNIALHAHSLNNMKMRFDGFNKKLDEMPEIIVSLINLKERQA